MRMIFAVFAVLLIATGAILLAIPREEPQRAQTRSVGPQVVSYAVQRPRPRRAGQCAAVDPVRARQPLLFAQALYRRSATTTATRSGDAVDTSVERRSGGHVRLRARAIVAVMHDAELRRRHVRRRATRSRARRSSSRALLEPSAINRRLAHGRRLSSRSTIRAALLIAPRPATPCAAGELRIESRARGLRPARHRRRHHDRA